MPNRPPTHRSKHPPARRPNANARGYDWRWRKASKLFLGAHPFCAECERRDIIAEARLVDHKIPHRGNERLFWDETNWQGLCFPCHTKKTAQGQ
jgi:5-methylcytosine-specific restriction protein A